MAGAWQIEQAPIAQLFTQGLLAGMARADQRRQEDNANALAMEETKARDSQVRAAMEHQRLEREAARQQTEQQRAAERAQRTQQIRYNMAKAVAARPELLPQFDAAIRRMSSGANAQIDPFELGGVHVNDGQGQFTHQAPSADEAEGIAVEAQAMGAQPERDNSMTRDMLNFAERQRNPDFAAYQDSRTPKPKTQPSTKAPKASPGGAPGPGGKIADQMRREWQGQQVFKDTSKIATDYEKIMKAGDTGAGHISMVFSYMKLLDPNSTVREGEFDQAMKTAGLAGTAKAGLERLRSGQLLTDEQKAFFREEAGHLFGAQLGRYDAAAEAYRNEARRQRLDPSSVVFDYGYKIAKPQPAPAAKVELDAAKEELRRLGAIP